MKKRIFSLLVTLIVAVSVILGVSIFASAENSDGLKQSAISLAENVTLKMEVAVAAPTDGAYAKITLPNGQVDATQLVASAPKNGDNYVFFAEVAVKDLAKDVTIEICAVDGTTLVAPATTTALAYCDAYTAQGGEFNALVGALKDYANAADYYFDYSKTATEAAEADFSKVADVKTSGTLPAGLTHRSATLLLESETTIRHYFELAEGKMIENYTFFVDANGNGACDAGEKLVPGTKKTNDDKTVYYVDIAGLTPNELDNAYAVGVTGAAGGTYTCEYGALTYAKRVYANDAVDTKNLAAAILGYNTEAGKLKGSITFDANGGANLVVGTSAYEYGVETPVVATATRDGYRLVGWFDANGVKYESVPASETGALSLKAVWSKVTHLTGSWDATKTSFSIMNGTPLYNVIYDANGVKLTNELTITMDLTAEASSGNSYVYFRHINKDGKEFRSLHTYNGAINQTGDKLSATEPTNVKLVYDLGAVVANDGVADVIPVDYYVNGVYKKTVTHTLPDDISTFNTTKNYFMQIYWAGQFETTVANLSVVDSSSNKVAYPADATLPEGTLTEYTPGTALPLAENATKAGAEFAGWYADAALTKPVTEVPAGATGSFKVYAKWNYYVINQSFDANSAGLSVSNGASGSSTVANGTLTWAPSTNNGNQPTITNAGAALSTVVTDGFATYHFEVAKPADANLLCFEVRLCNGTSGAVQANLLRVDGAIKAHNGTKVADLTTDLTAVDVVINFGAKTLSYYVNGLFVYSTTASDLETPDVYNQSGRSMNIRSTNASDAADKAIVFGGFYIVGGEVVSAHAHADKNDDKICDTAACGVAYDDGCDNHVDENDDLLCDNCDAACDDGCDKHREVEYVTTKPATLFAEGEADVKCAVCGEDLGTQATAKTEPKIDAVTTTSNGEDSVLKDCFQLSTVLTDGKTFCPTDENPDGNDLLIEFSILFNSSMDNFSGSNITFPGIYSVESIASDKGAPAFWYYIKANGDGITPGSYDDWTSNAVDKNDPDKYYCNRMVVEFDGWHRFGVRFHQNTKVDVASGKVEYTMTVTMYIDGIRVYEAELDAMNTKKANSHFLRLYTAEVVDGEVVYTDNAGAYASFYRYTAYVTENGKTAYFVTADKFATCGKDFVLDVERVNDPEDATVEVEDGVELSAKAYYNVK